MPRGALRETESRVWNAYVQLTSSLLQECLPRGESNPLRQEIVKRLKVYGLVLTDRQLHQRLYRGGFSFAFGLALVDVLTQMKSAGRAVQVPTLSVKLAKAIALAPTLEPSALRKSRARFPRPVDKVGPTNAAAEQDTSSASNASLDAAEASRGSLETRGTELEAKPSRKKARAIGKSRSSG